MVLVMGSCVYMMLVRLPFGTHLPEFKILPQSIVQHPPAVDSTNFACLGFGYDSQTDDYKVVRFVTNYFEENLDEGLMADWIHQAVGDSYHLIISFDTDNEKFSTLPLPKFGGTLAQYYLQILNFNGLLGATFYPREGTDKSFDLWVMNGSWTKQFSVEFVPGVHRPLGFWKNDELFLESSDHELVSFDPSTRELKNLGIHAYRETMQMIAYVESLVPINGRQEHEKRIIRWPAGGASN
ncbi:Detected protein of unknown function [Hibiscus syriacus]|uniref:F-box associated beta-propeller type 3 domain-containing protein n=1 Tax=Hibiscus syriacus TaxID=106335 RepID=A0A6A2XGP1_HIBSY|nr:Detected protein of unknown function [Hibiscus syriacus]